MPPREMPRATACEGLAGCWAVVRDTDMRRTISLIPNKSLVTGGEFNTVTSVELSEENARTVPGARLEVMPPVHLPTSSSPTLICTW